MNEQQFLQLISENQGILHKICRLYRDTSEDREDLFQEMVFQLWRAMGSFRSDAKPSTFIYRVALNTAITSFRKATKRKIITYADNLPDHPTEENNEREHRLELLTEAIKKLEEADRAIMALLMDEVSYREIGEIIGISENNVAVKINRIKNKIKKHLNL